jgi:hypothetical protein
MTDQHYYRLTDPRELGILLVRSCLQGSDTILRDEDELILCQTARRRVTDAGCMELQ